MVPLNGGENIGEDALGYFGKGVYPVWKYAQLEVQRPDRELDKADNQVDPTHENQTSPSLLFSKSAVQPSARPH
jgi:hypothetical protein